MKLPQDFYLSLLKFLLHSKRQLILLSTELGLTTMQAFTLLLADNRTPRSMKVFRSLYDCDASNITGIVDGLENKGLVMRADHPTDRRIKVIRLLPKGEQLKAQIMHQLGQTNESLLSILTENEAHDFVYLINKLSQATLSNEV